MPVLTQSSFGVYELFRNVDLRLFQGLARIVARKMCSLVVYVEIRRLLK